MDQAEAYCALARIAIGKARTGKQLRDWWRKQTVKRHQYGLSKEQEAELAALCRARIEAITAPIAA